jgi:hypothetical protein
MSGSDYDDFEQHSCSSAQADKAQAEENVMSTNYQRYPGGGDCEVEHVHPTP